MLKKSGSERAEGERMERRDCEEVIGKMKGWDGNICFRGMGFFVARFFGSRIFWVVVLFCTLGVFGCSLFCLSWDLLVMGFFVTGFLGTPLETEGAATDIPAQCPL